MQCSCGFPEAVPLASTDAKRADSRENGQKRKIPYGNDAPRARERTLSMPFWPRPRSLETRKQRGFPHSHRDDCCCDPLELKPEPRMNTGDVTDSCTEPFEHTVPQRTDPFRRVSLRTKATAGVVFVYPETRRAALKMPTSAFIGTNPELVENWGAAAQRVPGKSTLLRSTCGARHSRIPRLVLTE